MQPAYSAWKVVVLVPLFFFVPGAVIVAYMRDRYHANLPYVDMAVIAAAVSVGVSSLAGLTLAEAGRYSLTSLALVDFTITVLVAAATLLRRKSSRRYSSDAVRWWWLGLLAVAVLASIFFVGRFEAILSERDASPYIAEAVNMADRGTVPLENKQMAQLTPEEASVFYGSHNLAGAQEYNSGFRIENFARGQVNTRYLAIYSVILATGYRMFGLRGALTIVNPFLAVLAVLVLVVLARRLFGPKVALLSGLILAVNPLMSWFARYPIPEIYTMLFVFLGIFGFTLYYPKGNGYWGAISALAFATAITAHFDMYALLPIVAALLFVVFTRMVLRRERIGYLLWFIGPFLVLSTVGIASNVFYNGPYISSVLNYVPSYISKNLPLVLPGLLALAILVPLLLRLIIERGLFRLPMSLVKKYWRPALVVLVVAIALFAYLVMPYWQIGKKNADPRVAEGRARMVNRLAWYFTHVGMALALLGLALFVVFALDNHSLSLFLVAGLFSLLLIMRPWCNPLHMWIYRRFIPALIPLAVLFMAYGLVKFPGLFKAGPARRIGMFASAAALVVMLAFTIPYTAKIHDVVQYEGVLASNEELAQRLSGDRVAAIFYGPLARAYYPDTLRFVYGDVTFSYREDSASPAAFDAACDKLRSLGKEVYVVGLVEGLPPAAINQTAVPVGSQRVRFKFFPDEYNKRPSKTKTFMYDLKFYLLKGNAGSQVFSADISRGDPGVLVRGFGDLEEGAGLKYRWTGGVSEFRLPNPPGGDRLTLLMSLRAPDRPKSSPPVPVEVFANGKLVGKPYVSSDWIGLYTVAFPRSVLPDPNATSIDFTLKAPTFSPLAAGVSNDPRQLGLQVRGLSIRSEAR